MEVCGVHTSVQMLRMTVFIYIDRYRAFVDLCTFFQEGYFRPALIGRRIARCFSVLADCTLRHIYTLVMIRFAVPP